MSPMPEPKRQCQTCRFFQSAQLAGNGWCTHPSRQMESDVKILVRERELACRNAWGDDLWADSSSPATTPQPAESARRTFTYLNTRLDDEVTSVVDASARPAMASTGDDVVTVTAVRPSDGPPPNSANDVNAAAVADQEERARVMARGNRDAIASARQRHVQRRTQSNSTSETPPELSQDLLAGDQNHASEIDTSGSASATDTMQTALPEPTISSESVTSDVGLPRLRSFFRGEEEHEESAAPSPTTSHFDHVMMQAERIKERSAARRPSREKPAARQIEPVSAPEPDEHRLVWDVDPTALDVAFQRARGAIASPVNLEDDARAEPEIDQMTARVPVAMEPPPRIAIYQQLGQQDLPHHHEPQVNETLGDREEDDLVQLDPAVHAEYGDFQDQPAYEEDEEDVLVADESPRSSLWRSVNQRIRQRFRFHASPASDEVEQYVAEPVAEDPFDDLGVDGDVLQAHSGFQSNDPDTWYDPEDGLGDMAGDEMEWAADAGEYPAFGRDTDISPMTSEESWRLDEREFPEPQPVHWHESRRELLASLPPVEALDDSVQLVAATPQARPIEPIKPRRPKVDPSTFFDISEPEGLATLRAALFGSQGDAAVASPYLQANASTVAGSSESAWQSPRPAHDRPAPSSRNRPTVVDRDTYHRTEERFESETAAVAQEISTPNDWAPPRRQPAQRSVEPTIDQVSEDSIPRQRRRPTPPVVAPVGDKRCATCRSFQPTGDGTRGRCTNSWASARTSMVHADELACRSSFGDWWIAADDEWTHRQPGDQPFDSTRPAANREHNSYEESHSLRVRTRNVEE